MIFAQRRFFKQLPEGTECRVGSTSGLVRKADIADGGHHVRFVPNSDMTDVSYAKKKPPEGGSHFKPDRGSGGHQC
jgi:hypothetical protein